MESKKNTMNAYHPLKYNHMTNSNKVKYKQATPPAPPKKRKKYNTNGDHSTVKHSKGDYSFVFTGEIRGLVPNTAEKNLP